MPGLDFINLPLSGTPFGTALEVCVILAAVAWLLSIGTRESRGSTACGPSVPRSTA